MNGARVACAAAMAAVLVVASGCGGGSGSAGRNPGAAPAPPPAASGRAVLGPVVGADVQLFAVARANLGPLHSTVTLDDDSLERAGRFTIPADVLDDDELYVVRISGGTDVDADDDGVRDATPTPLQGAIRAVATGAELKTEAFQVNVTTELAYRAVAPALRRRAAAARITAALDQAARRQLLADLNSDGRIDRRDLLRFEPRRDGDAFLAGRAALLRAARALLANENTAPALRTAVDNRVGQLPGRGFGSRIAASGTTLYVAAGTLDVVDVSEPAEPALLGSVQFGNRESARAIAATGTTVLVALGSAGLAVVDAADPATPVERERVPTFTTITDVAIAGSIAYLVEAGIGVHVHDLSDGAAAPRIGTISFQDARAVAASGTRLAVGRNARIDLVDMTDPATPAQTAFVDTSGPVSALHVDDRRLIALTIPVGLEAWSLSTPEAPESLGTVTGASFPGRLAVDGERIYVSTPLSGIEVIRLSDSAPEAIGTLDGIELMQDIELVGDLLAVSGVPGTTLLTKDLPLPPELIATVPANIAVSGLDVSDGRAVLAEFPGGLQIVDVSDPAAPVVRSMIEAELADIELVPRLPPNGPLPFPPGTLPPPTGPLPIPPGVLPSLPGFLDPSDRLPPGPGFGPSPAPISVVFVSLPKRSVASLGDRILLPRSDGVRVLDAADPAMPVELGVVPFVTALGVAAAGERAFVAASGGRVGVLTPEAMGLPVLATEVELDGGPFEIAIDGSTGVVARQTGGIDLLDLSQTPPTRLASFAPREDFTLFRRTLAVAAAGGIVAFAESELGADGATARRLVLVDSSEPAAPTELARLETRDQIAAIAIADDLLIAAIGQRGLLLYSIADPTAPVELGSLDLPGSAVALAVRGDVLYVAAREAGLLIMATPTLPDAALPFD